VKKGYKEGMVSL